MFQVFSQVLVNSHYLNLCQSPEVYLPIPRFHNREEVSATGVQDWVYTSLHAKYTVSHQDVIHTLAHLISLNLLAASYKPAVPHAPVEKFRAISDSGPILVVILLYFVSTKCLNRYTGSATLTFSQSAAWLWAPNWAATGPACKISKIKVFESQV